MARTLICHVPQDAAAARELGAALMARGHAVSFDGEPDNPRQDRFLRLRLFDAIVILWSENSLSSGGLSEVAGQALRSNILVPVRTAGLDVIRLPLMYRKLNLLQASDMDAIQRLVARLSFAQASLKEMRERELQTPRMAARSGAGAGLAVQAAAQAVPKVVLPPPLPPPRLVAVAERLPEVGLPEEKLELDQALSLVTGGLAKLEAMRQEAEPDPEPFRAERVAVPPRHGAPTDDQMMRAMSSRLALRIPRSFRIGEAETLAVRFSGSVPAEDLPTVETVSVSLYAKGGAFDIRRGSDTTQGVAADPEKAEKAGHWEWLVTPLKPGPQRLSIRVSASLMDGQGAPISAALPDRDFEVFVAAPGYEPQSTSDFWTRVRALLGRRG